MSLSTKITNTTNLDVQVQIRDAGSIKDKLPAVVDVKITQFGKEAAANGSFPIVKQIIIPVVGKDITEAKKKGLSEAVELMGLS